MSETLRFPTAAVSVEALVVACRRLLMRLHWRLRGRAARRLRLRAALWGGRSWEKTLTFHEAVTDWERMLFIAKSVLANAALPAPVEELTIELSGITEERGRQSTLFAEKAGLQAAARRDGAPATGALGTASRIAGGGGGAVVATAGEASRPYRLRAVTGAESAQGAAAGRGGDGRDRGSRSPSCWAGVGWRSSGWRTSGASTTSGGGRRCSRLYYRLLLEDGRPLVVYHDLMSGTSHGFTAGL